MERILLFIKHTLKSFWGIIEWANGLLFSLFFKSNMNRILTEVFEEYTDTGFSFRKLAEQDIDSLHNMINFQDAPDLKYFNPHGFDPKSLKKQLKKPSFLMMGAFKDDRIAGYFFLRFFANKKCFVGRLIDKQFRGKGIGSTMNHIMYETAWRMGFRCLSTISKNNTSVMRAHAKNPTMVVLKELRDDYLLVEFIKEKNDFKKTI
jgi:hypothetical protein